MLELAAGCYRTGALHLKSGVELRLGSPGTLVQFIAGDPEEQYPMVFSHWEATPCYNYSALLYACDAADIAVTGSGVLDGGADASHWWDWHHQVEEAWSEDRPDLQAAARTALRRMNEEGVPVGQRVFGKGCWLRPNFVQFIRCERVLIRGVTFRNSPMWQLNPVQCRSVTVDGVTLSSHGPNNDGCDPESCQGVWIRNGRFDTGDDCISLKSGRDRDGREADLPCTDILIENNDFADGHGGIALGSEMSGGILRVLADNNRFSSPNLTYALRLKTNARRGGRVEQIVLRNSVMEHVHGAAVHGTMLYEDGRSGDFLPLFRDITVENIRASGGDYGIFLESFPEVPIRGLVLRNVIIDGVRRPLHGRNWQDAVVEQVVINGKSYPRPDGVRILGGAQPRRRSRGQGVQLCGGQPVPFPMGVLLRRTALDRLRHGSAVGHAFGPMAAPLGRASAWMPGVQPPLSRPACPGGRRSRPAVLPRYAARPRAGSCPAAGDARRAGPNAPAPGRPGPDRAAPGRLR